MIGIVTSEWAETEPKTAIPEKQKDSKAFLDINTVNDQKLLAFLLKKWISSLKRWKRE